mgnify:FL=1
MSLVNCVCKNKKGPHHQRTGDEGGDPIKGTGLNPIY